MLSYLFAFCLGVFFQTVRKTIPSRRVPSTNEFTHTRETEECPYSYHYHTHPPPHPSLSHALSSYWSYSILLRSFVVSAVFGRWSNRRGIQPTTHCNHRHHCHHTNCHPYIHRRIPLQSIMSFLSYQSRSFEFEGVPLVVASSSLAQHRHHRARRSRQDDARRLSLTFGRRESNGFE